MKKVIIIVIAIVMVITAVVVLPFYIKVRGNESTSSWSSTDAYSLENVQTIQMEKNSDFKILVLSDIQLNLPLPVRIKKTLELVEELIEEQNPDLIITTGDNVSFSYQGSLVKKLVAKMESFNIPWAVTLGNHDAEASVNRNWHGNIYENANNSMFKMGPTEVDGVGNYQINITNGDGKVVQSLIMLDSHAKTKYEDGKDYDYIKPSQLEWYKWVTDGLEKETGNKVPSLLFFHIPLIEFDDALKADDAKILFGEQNEDVYSAPISSGLFELILEQGSTTHIFNGHDHLNNISVLYKGITQTYCTKSGPCSYHDESVQGGTLITIKSGSNDIEVEHIYN